MQCRSMKPQSLAQALEQPVWRGLERQMVPERQVTGLSVAQSQLSSPMPTPWQGQQRVLPEQSLS